MPYRVNNKHSKVFHGTGRSATTYYTGDIVPGDSVDPKNVPYYLDFVEEGEPKKVEMPEDAETFSTLAKGKPRK